MKSLNLHLALAIPTLCLLMAQTGCNGSDTLASGEKATINLQLSAEEDSVLLKSLLPNSAIAADQVDICFKRLRFKRVEDGSSSDNDSDNSPDDNEENIETILSSDSDSDDDDSNDNVDFHLELVTVTNGSVDLGSFEIPAGDYRRIEFDLEDDCGTGFSLNVDGVETDDRMTIKFRGRFSATEADQLVVLKGAEIFEAIEDVDADELKDAAEGASGRI